jgi:hypothetical protein
MKSSIIAYVSQFFRNLLLNASGAERTLYEYIEDGDISHALNLMESNAADVDNALKEYYPQEHDVMKRGYKRTPRGTYELCKLPRARQRYINEIELFFLLANGIMFKKDEGDDEAYKLFTDFIKDTRYDTNMRKIKRMAGSETECAKLYRLYKDDNNKPQCDTVLLSRSLGYDLRILKDQYGHLVAFAYGYKLRGADGKAVQHWDFLTPTMTYECAKGGVGWDVESYANPTGRINLVYYRQPKAWEGAEPRMKREEEMDSKIGDTNNYFADPIALASADVIESMFEPSTPAKLLQATGKDSRFEYVNPPQASELRTAEKEDLKDSILFDTFTPDFSFDRLRGMGTLSGVAIRNAMALGYIKRANRMEIYGELVDRDVKVIIGVLQFLNPDMAAKLGELQISFEFAEPFQTDKRDEWQSIVTLYSGGLVSLEEAVRRLGLTEDPVAELERIMAEKSEQEPLYFGTEEETE